MSTTIGFGFKQISMHGRIDQVEVLASKYGYGLEKNADNAEDDMKGGLLEFAQFLEWDCFFLLKTPIDSQAALAFDIEEELSNREVLKVRPKFYDFLLETYIILKDVCDEFYLFFSGEWYKGDRLRMESGEIEDLLVTLHRPAHWNQRLFVPGTGHYHYSDEMPFVFRVLCNPNLRGFI